MQGDNNRCPKCKHGQHKKHIYDYMDRQGQVKVCKCKVCVPQKEAK